MPPKIEFLDSRRTCHPRFSQKTVEWGYYSLWYSRDGFFTLYKYFYRPSFCFLVLEASPSFSVQLQMLPSFFHSLIVDEYICEDVLCWYWLPPWGMRGQRDATSGCLGVMISSRIRFLFSFLLYVPQSISFSFLLMIVCFQSGYHRSLDEVLTIKCLQEE